MRGIVKKWFPKRGYGFIEGADGKNYFAHWKSIRTAGKWKYLEEGEDVIFVSRDKSGNSATAVHPIRGSR